MRTIIFAAALLPLAACGPVFGDSDDGKGIAPSGTGTQRSYAARDFTKVALRGSDNVDVRVGGAFAVTANGPADELDKLKIEKVGDTLRIGRKNNSFSWGSHRDVTVHVTMPALQQAALAGSGNLSVDRASGDAFAVESAGSGDISIGALAVTALDVSIAGSGNAKLGGTARALKAEIAGSGDIDASGLKADSAEVSIAGSGSVRAQVNGQANVSLMGSGDVDLGPNATCKTSKMGSGTVTCGK